MLSSPLASAPRLRIYAGERLVRELTGSNNAGMNQVIWDMDFSRERMPGEAASRGGGRGGRGGRGQRGGRGGGNPNRPGNLVYSPAPEGLYQVVLEVDGQEYRTNARILEDYWWDKRF